MKVIQVDIMHNEDVVKEPNNSLLIDAKGNKNCIFLTTVGFEPTPFRTGLFAARAT